MNSWRCDECKIALDIADVVECGQCWRGFCERCLTACERCPYEPLFCPTCLPEHELDYHTEEPDLG
jgi:hypothetical protein